MFDRAIDRSKSTFYLSRLGDKFGLLDENFSVVIKNSIYGKFEVLQRINETTFLIKIAERDLLWIAKEISDKLAIKSFTSQLNLTWLVFYLSFVSKNAPKSEFMPCFVNFSIIFSSCGFSCQTGSSTRLIFASSF